jgi:multiple sugar transport system permease protein
MGTAAAQTLVFAAVVGAVATVLTRARARAVRAEAS